MSNPANQGAAKPTKESLMLFDAQTTFLVSSKTAVFAVATCLCATGSFAKDLFALKSSRNVGDLARVTVALEVEGQLKLNPDGKKVITAPIKVDGKLCYDERILDVPGRSGANQQVCSVRHYQQAQADIHVGGGKDSPALGEDNRLIVAERSGTETTLFSPTGPLPREQLDLIDVPGNSLLATGLLPGEKVRLGHEWKHEGTVLAGLLGLEAVHQCDVKSRLTEVRQNSAKIELSGHVSGAVGGVASEIDVKAEYRFDLAKRRITWLAMAIKEKRSISHVSPGFDVNARLRMRVAPLDKSPQLTDEALADLPLRPDKGVQMLAFASRHGHFKLLHERRWHVISDIREVTVLRFVDRGELVAQCNISKLPDLPAGKQVPLETFQQDIHKTLGESFRQLVDASQTKTDAGLRILRVAATGSVADVPILWIYYLISNDQGRRVALVFTLESELAERFAAADQALVSSFQFARRPKASELDPSATEDVASESQD